jgi:signal transduction histidine kinase
MALMAWSQRLRLPLALDDPDGRRIAASDSFSRRMGEPEGEGAGRRSSLASSAVTLADGRTLWIVRPSLLRRPPPGPSMDPMAGGPGFHERAMRERSSRPAASPAWMPGLPAVPGLAEGTSLVVLVGLLFLAVSAGAYPVVRRLTRRLEALKSGVQAFGAGDLQRRVPVSGRDEVAAVAASFNEAAGRIEALLRANQSLLANASHELRSPLARLKMAVSMLDDADASEVRRLRDEINTDIAELDALVEEVLLASRLDAARDALAEDPVDLLALAVEEAARVGAAVDGGAFTVRGDERLLRRALRNLLENARRYGGSEVTVRVRRQADKAEVMVCDRGPGVPPEHRERIFEAFFRLPGHAEREGGVGLGLSLVRQIAQRHGGGVRCEAREGGGSCFVLSLPGAPGAAPTRPERP